MTAIAAKKREDLRAIVRYLLNEYTSGSGAFWTDTVLNSYLELAFSHYNLFVCQFNPDRFLTQLTAITVVNGTASYALTNSPFVVWCVYWRQTLYSDLPIYRNPLFKDPSAVEQSTLTINSAPAYLPQARIVGGNIELSPTPGAVTATLIPEVIEFPAFVSADAVALDAKCHPIVHNLIALKAAELALIEDAEDPNVYSRLTQTIQQEEQYIASILMKAQKDGPGGHKE